MISVLFATRKIRNNHDSRLLSSFNQFQQVYEVEFSRDEWKWHWDRRGPNLTKHLPAPECSVGDAISRLRCEGHSERGSHTVPHENVSNATCKTSSMPIK